MILKLGIIIYILASLVHLVFAFLEKEILRKITKPFILGILLIILIIQMIYNKNFDVYLFLALLFGLIGDVLLIFDHKKKLFLFGGLSFFFGHVFYIVKIIAKFPFTLKWYFYVIILVMLLLWIVVSYPKFKPILKEFSLPCSIYSFVLIVGLSVSIITFLNHFTKISLLVPSGFLFFFISDTILTYSIFYKPFKRSHFYLMLFYILAQAMLFIGLSLL